MNARVPVLVLEGGGWRVGVDAGTIARVEALEPGDTDQDPSLADIVGIRPGRPFVRPRRSVHVTAPRRTFRLRVERTSETRLLSPADMQPVPEMLRRFGAPGWWLGLTWDGDEPVLLVDLEGAVEADGSGAGR